MNIPLRLKYSVRSRVRQQLRQQGLEFFDADLQGRIDAGLFAAMNHFGGSVRLRAQRSIRRPRRKRMNELTPRELAQFRDDKDRTLEFGYEKAVRPYAPSAPGEPPRSHSRMLPDSILYAYEASSQTVLIGPRGFNSRPGEATHALEFGGVSRGHHVAARPFMKPAFDKALDSDVGRAFTNLLKAGGRTTAAL